jgi:mannose-1-phosphate guanylyltransferase
VSVLAAMVLAAGFGTRLRPLTDVCAKALLPVGDRAALAHVFEQLRGAGAERIVVNAHHRADEVRAFARRQGRGVAVSEETELLGTAGGIAHAAGLLGAGDVIVWNADVLAEVDLRALVASHAMAHAEATLVIQPRASGRGPIGVDEQGRIVRLRDQRFGPEAHGGEFLGISVVGAALRARLPGRGCLVGDAWLPALRDGVAMRAFGHEGVWRDIGTPASYLRANLAWLEGRGLANWAGDGARIAAGVSLDQTILGEGALAEGAGPLARCVVWPGARATAPLANAVVARGLVVRVLPTTPPGV